MAQRSESRTKLACVMPSKQAIMKWKLCNGAAQRRRGVKASVATTEALALQRSGKLAWVMPSQLAIMKWKLNNGANLSA